MIPIEERGQAITWFQERLTHGIMPGARKMYQTALDALSAQRWIPVEEALPAQDANNSSRDCLIAIKYKYDQPGEKRTICSGYLLDGEWWSYSDHSCNKIGSGKFDCGDIVTHWMYLPEPPAHEEAT